MLQGLSVLVVDDGGASRRQTVSCIEANDHITMIDEATDGTQAIDMMIAKEYDMVFMDIVMPGLSGMQVIAQAKEGLKDTERKFPMVVMMSSQATSDTYIDANQLGVTEFLRKPVTILAVENLVEAYQRLRTPMRVLVVDDSQTVRRLVGKIMRRSEFSLLVDEAASGEEAIEMIKKTPYDALFLDVNMPDMNGIQVLAKILTSHPKLKTVLMSGEPLKDIQGRAGSLKIEVFLSKPFTPLDLDIVIYGLFSIKPPRLRSKAVALMAILES